MAQKNEWDTSDGELIYTSTERGNCYKYARCLWCACLEPYHKITTKYVRVHQWDGCSQIADSMAMDAVADVSRDQSCCCCLASCACSCCINDFADLTLYGVDDTEADGQLKLINVADSYSVLITIIRHLQELHADFRENAKAFGKTLNQQKTTNKPTTTNPPKSITNNAKPAVATHEDVEEEKVETELSEVSHLLSRLKLVQYIDAFKLNGFQDMKQLKSLTNLHLMDLGVAKMADRMVILEEINAYFNNTSYNHALQQPLKHARDPLVIFLGISTYKDQELYPELNDISKDETFLRATFEKEFGYKFVSNDYENKIWNKKEVINWIRKQRDELLIPAGRFMHDSIIFCAAGHGNIHALVCSDGVKLERKGIRSQFAANVRGEFDNLPKLFIFNCCRVDDDEARAPKAVSQAVEYSLSVVGTEGDEVYGPKLSKFVAASFKNNYDDDKDQINVYKAIKKAKQAAANAVNGMKIRVEELDTDIDDVVFIKKEQPRGSPDAARKKDTRQKSPEKASKT